MPDADDVFLYAWIGAAAAMIAHIGGLSLGWWSHRAATYWIALVFLLAMAGTVADGFRGDARVE